MEAVAMARVPVKMVTAFVVTTSTGPVVKTAEELIETIDMLDCFNPWQDLDEDEGRWEKVWHYDGREWRECDTHGPHHSKEPLYIAITDAQTGLIVEDGYGTDH